MTSLRGNNEVEVKFENSMHNYNITLVKSQSQYHPSQITNWDFRTAVLVVMLFTKWSPSNNQIVTDGTTLHDINLANNIIFIAIFILYDIYKYNVHA